MAAKNKNIYIATVALMANRKVTPIGQPYTPRSNEERESLLKRGDIVPAAEWEKIHAQKRHEVLKAAGLDLPGDAPASGDDGDAPGETEPAKGENNPAE